MYFLFNLDGQNTLGTHRLLSGLKKIFLQVHIFWMICQKRGFEFREFLVSQNITYRRYLCDF